MVDARALVAALGRLVPSAFGAARGLAQAGTTDRVKLVGFDAAPEHVDQLRAGMIDALIAQRAVGIDAESVKVAVAYLATKQPPTQKVVTIGFSVGSRADAVSIAVHDHDQASASPWRRLLPTGMVALVNCLMVMDAGLRPPRPLSCGWTGQRSRRRRMTNNGRGPPQLAERSVSARGHLLLIVAARRANLA